MSTDTKYSVVCESVTLNTTGQLTCKLRDITAIQPHSQLLLSRQEDGMFLIESVSIAVSHNVKVNHRVKNHELRTLDGLISIIITSWFLLSLSPTFIVILSSRLLMFQSRSNGSSKNSNWEWVEGTHVIGEETKAHDGSPAGWVIHLLHVLFFSKTSAFPIHAMFSFSLTYKVLPEAELPFRRLLYPYRSKSLDSRGNHYETLKSWRYG